MKNVDLQKIIYMNTLIAHRRTGTPEVFAQKLNLSRSADLMLEILYSCYSQTYYYGEKDFCALMGGECCNNCQRFQNQ